MPKIKRSVLSADVKPETLERLKEICKLENKSQAKVLEFLIDNYQGDVIKEIAAPREVKLPTGSKPGNGIKAGPPPSPKVNDKGPTMADLLKQSVKAGLI